MKIVRTRDVDMYNGEMEAELGNSIKTPVKFFFYKNGIIMAYRISISTLVSERKLKGYKTIFILRLV